MAVRSDHTGRRQVTEVDVAEVVTYLREQLGERLTAVIAGVTDAGIVRAWAADDRVPDAATEQRLRTTYEVTGMLLEVDSAETVRLWFSGMNPELDDRSPALTIAEDPEGVRAAARIFVVHG